MSKIAITGAATGTATFTIESPATSTNRTLTIPDEAGTITTSNSPYSTFRNRIINGDMRIAQRGTAAVSTDATFPVDRWRQSMSGGGVLTSNQATTAPTGFINSTLVTISTADATIAAADFYNFNQQIEGFNIADLGFGTANAQSVTLSFWVRSSATGTFAGCLSNSAANRSYIFTYDILVANTFEYKTVEIEGDTSGTWLSNNGIGIRVVFDLGGGSDSQGTVDTWQSGFKSATASSVKLISTLNATFFITGVQLEVGAVATPFERRPFGTELSLCQRYFEKNEPGATNGVYAMGYSTANNAARYVLFFKTTKRATPTISVSGNTHFFGQTGTGSNVATATLVGSLASLNQTGLLATFAGASFTDGQGSQLLDNNSGNSSISASAEL